MPKVRASWVLSVDKDVTEQKVKWNVNGVEVSTVDVGPTVTTAELQVRDGDKVSVTVVPYRYTIAGMPATASVTIPLPLPPAAVTNLKLEVVG